MDRSREGLRVRVFGGLEVWYRGRRWREFETRKAEALFGYLVVNDGRIFGRGALAGLLWPEMDDARARQNLRQALYSVAATLPRSRKRYPWLNLEGDRVGLNPGAGLWSDAGAFGGLLRDGGLAPERIGTHLLGRAVQLYRGDLLTGLEVRESPEFELWLVGEQERFRTLAMDALRRLGTAYLARGEHRLGLEYARRLVELDPFNEEGHRLVMALSAVAGNRSGAVTHFRALVELLEKELGVPPAQQTRELFQRIAAQAEPAYQRRAEPEPRPFVPLVGRDGAMEQLYGSWRTVASGQTRVTVIEGELGVGKTRFVRSFLDGLSVREDVRILTVETEPRRVHPPFAPVDRMISRLIEEGRAAGADPVAGLSPFELRALAAIVPGFVETARAGPPARGAMSVEQLARGCAALIHAASRPRGDTPQPLVVFLDDLHHAPGFGLHLLGEVLRRLVCEHVWVLAVCDREAVKGKSRLLSACEAMNAVADVEVVTLARLLDSDLETLAAELFDVTDAKSAAAQLQAASQGLPLGVVLSINLWWDEGRIVPSSSTRGSWEYTDRWNPGEEPEKRVAELAENRVRHLSPFLRRVLTLGATLGATFDADLLAAAEGESRDLVVSALERLLERWLLLTADRTWSTGRGQSPAQVREFGARAPRYEFDHEILRSAVLARVSRERRRALHQRVAEVAARSTPGAAAEFLAHHYLEAGDYPQALAALRRVIERCEISGVEPSCLADLVHQEAVLERACRLAGRP